MKLEQIYESYYVDPLVAINSSSAADLLEAFEQAVAETPNVGKILASLNEGQMPVNESELTNEQKIFFIGATKLVNAYKESNDTEFKARFESIVAEVITPIGRTAGTMPTAAPKTTAPAPAASSAPTTATTSTAPKKGFLGKLGSFFGNIGRGIAAFTRGLVQGFEGSEGKDKTGKDKPGWTSAATNEDLSKIPERGVVFTPDVLKKIGVDSESVSKLQNGEISGINLTDSKNNLISINVANGRIFVKRIPTWPGSPAIAGKGTPPKQKSGGRVKGASLTQTPTVVKKPQQKAATVVKKPQQKAATVVKKPQQKAAASAAGKQVIKFPGTPPKQKSGGRAKGAPLSQTPGAVKNPQQKTVSESQFQNTVREVLKEFYETSK
jgi:hypothetical protein